MARTRRCMICQLLIPFDMDTPIIGRLITWHVNHVARKDTLRMRLTH